MESVSKGEFAAMISVSRPRVSQFLKDGKIYGPAIDGDGHRSRIHPEIAIQQLGISIDPTQGYGANGKAAMATPTARQPQQPSVAPAADTPFREQDKISEQLAQERLKQQQYKTAQMEREELASAGVYMRTADARRETGRAVGDAFKVMEQGLPDMATALSEEFSLPQRDLQKALSRVWRDVRERAARGFRADRDSVPETIPADHETALS